MRRARAILPADATWPAPFPAAPNTDPAPAPGSIQPVGGDELAIVNDTNFGSTGRNASLPDYSDFIRVRVPGLRRARG